MIKTRVRRHSSQGGCCAYLSPSGSHGGGVLSGASARNQRIQPPKSRNWKPGSPAHFLKFLGILAGRVELVNYGRRSSGGHSADLLALPCWLRPLKVLTNKIRDIAYQLSLNDNHAYITENDRRDKSIKACGVADMNRDELAVMKMGDLPVIQFSHWYEWDKRESFQDGHLPGVYVIASFDGVAVPDGPGDPLDSHVIYIGEASRTLHQRWKAFEDSAFDPTTKGRRAKKYRIIFSGLNKDSLFTAAMTSSHVQWIGLTAEDIAQRLGIPLAEAQRKFRQFETRTSAKDKGVKNKAWVKLVERLLLFRYIHRWDKLPVGNSE